MSSFEHRDRHTRLHHHRLVNRSMVEQKRSTVKEKEKKTQTPGGSNATQGRASMKGKKEEDIRGEEGSCVYLHPAFVHP